MYYWALLWRALAGVAPETWMDREAVWRRASPQNSGVPFSRLESCRWQLIAVWISASPITTVVSFLICKVQLIIVHTSWGSRECEVRCASKVRSKGPAMEHRELQLVSVITEDLRETLLYTSRVSLTFPYLQGILHAAVPLRALWKDLIEQSLLVSFISPSPYVLRSCGGR